MTQLPRRPGLALILAACVALAQALHAAPEDLRGTIVDVATAVVVQMKVEAGEATPGQLARATRDGQEVARLKIRTANGVLQVLQGDVQVGDKVEGLPHDPDPFGTGQGDPGANRPPDPTALTPSKTDEQLRPLLEAQGLLAVGQYQQARLAPKLAKPLEEQAKKADDMRGRLNAAARVLRLDSQRARVAATLRDLGETELARRIVPEAEASTPLAPILPAGVALRLASDTYGQIRLIDPQPQLWRLPQFWGRDSLPPAFSGWQMDVDTVRIANYADALVRTDFALDDVEIRGEVQPDPEGFIYLILRSEVVVRFALKVQGDAFGSVAAKVGYNNLNHLMSSFASDAWEYAPPLKQGSWVPFTVRLQGQHLTVTLDGDKLLDTTLNFGPNMPATGHVGMGVYRGSGAFRNITVQALTDSGSRGMPLFANNSGYEPDGAPIDLLGLPQTRFMSLSHQNEEDWKQEHHAVADDVLSITGVPFSQFAVSDTAGDHWRVAGRVRLADPGSVWFRANKYLFFGLYAKNPGDTTDSNPSLMTKYNTGNFRVYSEKFEGPELTARRWYSFDMEFHDPVAVFKLEGQTVMLATARTADHEPHEIGPNQFGISANATSKAEVTALRFQKLRSADRSLNPDAVRRTFHAGFVRVDEAIAYLRTLQTPNAPIAVAILDGSRPPALADATDFVTVAQRFRDDFDWPTYLAILRAEYSRYPEADPRRAAGEERWTVEQQKYEIALEVATPGEVGIDNIIRAGSGEPGPVALDSDRRHVWYALKNGTIYRFDPQSRKVDRRLLVDFTVRHLLARPTHLIASADDGRSVYRLDPDSGARQQEVRVPAGRILDIVAHPRLPYCYIAVDENTAPRKVDFAKYRVYTLDEKAMTVDFSGAHGQFLAADPLGRYIYTGMSWQVQMDMEFDPGGFSVIPVGNYIDLLVAYSADGPQLAAVGQNPSPGIAGQRIVVDGQGRSLVYVGLNGFFDQMNAMASGQNLAALRATAVTRVLGAFEVGDGLQIAAFHPNQPILYAIVKGQLRVFNSRSRTLMRTESLPKDVADKRLLGIQPTPGGRFLMIAYAGNHGGIYLHPLPDESEVEPELDHDLLSDPRAALQAALQLPAGDARTARLQVIAENFAFTAVGEDAAHALLQAAHSPYTAETPPEPALPPLSLDDLPAMPTWDAVTLPAERPAAGASLRRDPRHGENDEFRETLVDLISFADSAASQPWSWLFECQTQERSYPDSVRLKLLAADRLRQLQRPAAVATLATQVLALTERKGWNAAQAYLHLAWAAETADATPHRLAYLEAARAILPQNAIIHRELARACAAAALPHRARYHQIVSLRTFPGQPELEATLHAAKAMPPSADRQTLGIADLFRLRGPSIVLVRQEAGLGTGFLVSRDGLVLTNQHVIGDSDRVTVTLEEGDVEHELPAIVLATDRQRDMALLQVDLGDIQVEPLVIAAPGGITTGDRVVVIGNPGMGTEVLTKSITEGIISKTVRRINGHPFIQTSAAVNPGNSGGPMFNLYGEVIGMVTLKANLDNVGFAIPTADLLRFINENL